MKSKINLSILTCFIIWIISILGWISSFLEPISLSSIYLSVRFVSLISGISSFLIFLIIFIKNRNINEKYVKYVQLISIFTALVATGLMYFYEDYIDSIDKAISQYIFPIMFFSWVISFFTLLMSLVILIQKKRLNILILLNLLVAAYPLFWFMFLILFLGIGFGPPS